ncbi:MAG: ABC transporter ATP-binding protein/permease, partial [Candidatus Heimdallarchaeota archaeon]|nr:ABC transporter ATP-binding protein/permease [Candidatus Heimdallarchaeota archaeon]
MRRHGGAMFADKSKTRDTRVLLAILWKYLSEFKNQVIGVSFIILFYAIAATYQPIIIKDAIDLVLTDANDNQIFILITIFFVLAVIVWSLQSINTWIITGIRTQLVNKVRSDSFEKLVEADMSFHHKNQSGNVTARVVNDTQDIATGLQVVSTVTTQLLLIIATLIVLFSIGWMFVLISLLAVPTAMIIAKFFGTIGKKRMLATRQTYGQVSGRLAENLAGVSIAKAFNQEEKVSKEIESLNYKAYGYMKQLIVVFILVFPSISMVSTILVFGVLMLGGYLTTTSDITVGTIFLATIMVQRFLQPVIQLANNYTQLQASLAALDRVADVLEAKPSVQNKENAIPLKFNAGKVEFSDVSFEYIKDTPVLQHISFDVSAGSKIALVGHTGAGKTTITSLLMRFYDPKQGFIAIDDQKLIDITLES